MNNHQLNIPLDQTTAVICSECSGEVFVQGMFLRKASRVLTGNPTDGYLPIPTFFCANCGAVNEEFKPKEQSVLK